jgi:hypothetical protein
MDNKFSPVKDIKSSYVESNDNAITGFRPMRSATIPQKIDAKALPTIYDAPTIEVLKEYAQNIDIFVEHRSMHEFWCSRCQV